MLGLEGQATALAATVTGLTAAPELQQFAARMRAQAGDAKRMRELMGEWHQPVPAPYSPGASLPAGMMGTGMMHAADWAEISHEHGQSFSSRWLDAMISSYEADRLSGGSGRDGAVRRRRCCDPLLRARFPWT
jgi:uncharacterized protein (DUF305 family)